MSGASERATRLIEGGVEVIETGEVPAIIEFLAAHGTNRAVDRQIRQRSAIAGTNEIIIDAIGRYAELGFDEVIVPDFGLGDSSEERSQSYDRFASEIIPQL